MNVISVYTGLKQYIKARTPKQQRPIVLNNRVSAMATLTMLPCQSCQQFNHKMRTFLVAIDVS